MESRLFTPPKNPSYRHSTTKKLCGPRAEHFKLGEEDLKEFIRVLDHLRSTKNVNDPVYQTLGLLDSLRTIVTYIPQDSDGQDESPVRKPNANNIKDDIGLRLSADRSAYFVQNMKQVTILSHQRQARPVATQTNLHCKIITSSYHFSRLCVFPRDFTRLPRAKSQLHGHQSVHLEEARILANPCNDHSTDGALGPPHSRHSGRS